MARPRVPREVDKRAKRDQVEALRAAPAGEMRTNIIQNYPARRSRLSHISLSKGVFIRQGWRRSRWSVHRARRAACSFSTHSSSNMPSGLIRLFTGRGQDDSTSRRNHVWDIPLNRYRIVEHARFVNLGRCHLHLSSRRNRIFRYPRRDIE